MQPSSGIILPRTPPPCLLLAAPSPLAAKAAAAPRAKLARRTPTFTGVLSHEQLEANVQQARSSKRYSNSMTPMAQLLAPKVLRFVQTRLAHSGGARSLTERTVREQFGNVPDISKALRLLVGERKLRREGRGGKADPFAYRLLEEEGEEAEEEEGAGGGQ